MKSSAIGSAETALLRRDLVAIFAYIDRRRDPARCLDGSFESPDVHLDRLAAAARMQ